ncbi:YihY/virulence factor BrkB family protein [Antarcticibacterium sp. 1MA-6-2]|uniref:YihY/virulence factor BrkB family protein n=1 Tax=Antarcticibacterium sp. 1MA-6-2 TaxID=2908210 RepID=UPI001F22919E|nr:YihY/virulence factor BrkB family protein [Antarcticibacterium sp. 1MA-6-2]UJH90769.1 YihY/virulence factor BrkB family protein [Antarcticibacterium sp. 1MA-6-2]
MKRIKKIKSPKKIKFSGWKKIIVKVKDRIAEDNLTIVAAGVAFYAFLAIFPALVALLSIYGLAVDPQQAEQQITQLSGMMPKEAFSIIKERIDNFLETSGSTLGWGTALGILISLWSANAGTKSLFAGIDIAYNTKNKRGFIKQNALTLVFTLGAIITLFLSMALIVIFPAVVHAFGLPEKIDLLVSWLRWPLLAGIVIFVISLIYKFAPDRGIPKFKWVMLGASLATILWLIASLGFSFYVSNFGNYGEMYGSISAVVIMLLWLFLTSFIILIGAEVNAQTEVYAEENY